jgi:hypothetical protein
MSKKEEFQKLLNAVKEAEHNISIHEHDLKKAEDDIQEILKEMNCKDEKEAIKKIDSFSKKLDQMQEVITKEAQDLGLLNEYS